MQKEIPIIMAVLADYTGRLSDPEPCGIRDESGNAPVDSVKNGGNYKASWKWSLLAPSFNSRLTVWKKHFAVRE